MNKINLAFYLIILFFSTDLHAQENDSLPRLGSVDQVDNRIAIDKEPKPSILELPLIQGILSLDQMCFSMIMTKKKKILVTILLVIVLLLIWVELAVGIFGTPFAGN